MGANPGRKQAADTAGEYAGLRFIDRVRHDPAVVSDELQRGLQAERASIAPKFFYDRLGSTLFTAICELPEYYPTRTEAGIIERHLPELCERIPTDASLIDLGAGDCTKAARLLPYLSPAQYVAVDISSDFVRSALERLNLEHPQMDLLGLGLDFSRELLLPPAVRAQRRFFLYPGSSIGNFTPPEAGRFLRQLRRQTDPAGGLLIGVDLVKPAEVLELAYDDPLGVTAAFNLNVLNHVNRLLGSNFLTQDWRHVALYNSALARIEMYLESRRPVQVRWSGGERHFVAGERIHTENSYKYTPPLFEALLTEAGFVIDRFWSDERGWFGVFLARAG